MALNDLIEPAAFDIFKHINGKSVSGNDLHDTLFTSIAISLRRIADAMAPKAEYPGKDLPEAPNPETQFSADTQHLSPADADLGAGIELAQALLMMHRSGRYHELIHSCRDTAIDEPGLVVPLAMLHMLFHAKSASEIERQLLAVPGSRIYPTPMAGEHMFVSMADIDA